MIIIIWRSVFVEQPIKYADKTIYNEERERDKSSDDNVVDVCVLHPPQKK